MRRRADTGTHRAAELRRYVESFGLEADPQGDDMPEQTCRFHAAVDEMRHGHAEAIEAGRAADEAQRMALAQERAERLAADAAIDARLQACESVTRPWLRTWLTVGGVATAVAAAYAKAKGWI